MTKTTDLQALAEAAARAMWRGDAASQGLGMRLLRVAPGEAEIAMETEPRMANGHGACHGGFLFMLADSAFACNSFDRRTVGQACSITYLRPGIVGSTITARARQVAQAVSMRCGSPTRRARPWRSSRASRARSAAA
jgi:acyl-CoA thioesterase